MRRVWTSRRLVYAMVRMWYQLRYRQSMMGLLWAVVPPLATLGVALIVFHGVARISSGGQPYALLALSGLVPWTFFANSLLFGVQSVFQASTIVSRLSFPRAVLPIGQVGATLIDLAVSTLLFGVFAFAVGEGLPLTALWFPALVLIEIVFVMGLVLFASALNVFARDIRLAVPVAVQLLLFVTPVMYPLSSVPSGLRPWFRANPLTGLIESFRDVLVVGTSPDPALLLSAVVGSVVVFVVGAWYFAATERRFADVI